MVVELLDRRNTRRQNGSAFDPPMDPSSVGWTTVSAVLQLIGNLSAIAGTIHSTAIMAYSIG